MEQHKIDIIVTPGNRRHSEAALYRVSRKRKPGFIIIKEPGFRPFDKLMILSSVEGLSPE
jgi:hypothetical protein